jgi:hypothetical protein
MRRRQIRIFLDILLTLLLCPHRWLVARGRKDEAAETLRACSDDPDADGARLAEAVHREIAEERAASSGASWYQLLFHSDAATQRKLVAGVGTAAAQELCGIDGVQYYLLAIFEVSGIDGISRQYQCLIVVGCLKVAMILVAAHLFDRNGRKPLLLASNVIMCGALVVLAASGTAVPYLSLAAVAVYVSSFSLGMGPGAWLVPSEVFSNDIRATAMSMATFVNRSIAFANTSVMLTLLTTMRPAGVFLM